MLSGVCLCVKVDEKKEELIFFSLYNDFFILHNKKEFKFKKKINWKIIFKEYNSNKKIRHQNCFSFKWDKRDKQRDLFIYYHRCLR